MNSTRCKDPVARFFARTVPEPNTGCLLWTGAGNRKGYGLHLFWPSGDTLAHRAAWWIANGPIPHGLFVLHRCDTPACVNVDHLFLGTIADNNLDRDRKGRWAAMALFGERNAASKLTDDDVASMRQLRTTGLTYAAIGQRFAVSESQARNICLGIRRSRASARVRVRIVA